MVLTEGATNLTQRLARDRRQMSVLYAAESPYRLPCLINTTFTSAYVASTPPA
jgi:hypothetical protein